MRTNIVQPLYDHYIDLPSEDSLFNPLMDIPAHLKEKDELTEFYKLCNEYYSPEFGIKYLLGMNLYPFQMAAVRGILNHKFPLLLFTRGGGKTLLLAVYAIYHAIMFPGQKVVLVSASFRQSKLIFSEIQKMYDRSPLLQMISEDKPRISTDNCHYYLMGSSIKALPLGTGDKIRGERGHVILCDEFNCLSSNSMVDTVNGIVRIGDLIDSSKSGDIPVELFTGDDSVPRECPDKYIRTPHPVDTYEVITKHGYSFKCSEKHRVMTNNGWKLAKDLTPNDYLIFENKYEFPDKKVTKNNIEVDEDIAWLMGALTAEGTISNKYNISFCSTDYNFIDRVQRILKGLSKNKVSLYEKDAYIDHRGWNCKKRYDVMLCDINLRENLVALGLERCTSHNKIIPHSILKSPKEVVISFLSGLFEGDGSAIKYNYKGSRFKISYYSVNKQLCQEVQYVLSKFGIMGNLQPRKTKGSDNTQWSVNITGVDAIELCNLLDISSWDCDLSDIDTRMLTEKGVHYSKSKNRWKVNIYRYGKNHHIGYYSNEKDAISAFESAKREMPRGLKVKSVTLLSERETLYDFHLPQTHSFMANGFRQHNSVPIEIFDVVVRGFAATESDPFAKTRDKLLRLHKKQANNVPKDDDMSDIMLSEGNKIVLSGTAGFKGGTFYQVYKQYLAIIRNGVKGKIGDYTELFEDDIGLHEDVEVDSSDYCIMRYTYKDLLTCRMQDKKVIENAKQTMPDALFRMEYMCFMEYTPIITDSGIKKIRDVQPGDKVLTHKGRFRPVKNSIKQQYSGNMIRYKTWGCNQEYIATATHPYWQKDDKWLSITDICEKDSRRTYLANLKELTSKIQIDVRNFTKNYTERKDRVFPKCSQTILSNKQVQDILSSTKSKKELSEMYGVSLTTIYDVYYLQKNMPKGAIPRNIKLDYNFGVIVGYYASEGSIGSRGRSCSFSFDGHICQDLKVYIDQLEACINEVFGIKTKVYKRDNNANVVINNRIVSDLMSAVCPGVAHTKFVQPDILFSNEEFMKGFIVGYWNGDGHVSGLNTAIKSNSASQNLLFQVKSVLSYFGIVSCFRHLKSAGRTVIKGKEYNTKDQFSVEMHGSNAQKFREIFYEDKNTFSDSKYYYNDGNASVFHIKEFNKFPYSGSVYNLEVEEDNSFSLPNATVHNSEFADDSLGFFKPRDIESATCRPGTGFGVQLRGIGKRHYIMGVDPAKTHDRFAIIIIELGTPNKIVYCWTMADSERTYTTGAKKIRELLRKFNIIAIAMDEGGGGLAIEEMINYPSLMEDTENKIYRHDDETPEAKNGNRMLYMFAFNSNWIDDANTLLQKNIEDKVIMFPRAQADTEGSQESFAHKDDAAFEILELKKELISIEVNYSKTGRKQFNLAPPDPQKDIDGAVRHKDRYSALLLGNYVASRLDKINYDELDFARKNFYETIKHAGWADDLAEQGDFIMD